MLCRQFEINWTFLRQTGINPSFDWTTENEPNNIIYFSVVGDMSENLISRTYTTDKFWSFYDLSNVVLNVTPNPDSEPVLLPSSNYNYVLMGVSVDNWIHTMVMKSFQTNC